MPSVNVPSDKPLYHNAQCLTLSFIILTVIMLSVVMPSVNMLSANTLCQYAQIFFVANQRAQ
jgi:hypothetical protein